jgi:pimeloyl-ACP methyl ester carboxylesterase
MPVSRDLSPTKRRMILQWLDHPIYLSIADRQELAAALQTALEIEHATIPPYLYALYSLKPEANREVAVILRSIVIEEMQHMALCCNLLNAIGASPRLADPSFVLELFAPLAAFFVRSGFMPRLFAWRARHTDLVKRLMAETGSTAPAAQLEHYATLARNPGHVAAAIGMMAHWNLKALEPELADLAPEVLLITGARDRMIAPADSLRLRRILPHARLELLPGLGHLAHEEAPERVAALILEAYDAAIRGGIERRAAVG